MNVQGEKKRYLVACDFDQTLSYNDSGAEVARVLGVSTYQDKVRGLARQNFVNLGAELAAVPHLGPGEREQARLDPGGVAPGKPFIPWDQIDYTVGAFLISFWVYWPGFSSEYEPRDQG